MPPRSVCLNVFTTSLGDSNLAVNNDGRGNPMMERRDSAQSGMSTFTAKLWCFAILKAKHTNYLTRYKKIL